MRETILALGLTLAVVCAACHSFQERQIYYNEEDNVCEHGLGFDWVSLDFILDGVINKKVSVKIHTDCEDWAFTDAEKIVVPTKWGYIDEENEVLFDESVRPIAGDEAGIVVRTTLRPSAKVNGKPYVCAMKGSG
jgi:hypothetical protein